MLLRILFNFLIVNKKIFLWYICFFFLSCFFFLQGKEGCFLVRNSSREGMYTLSVLYVLHFDRSNQFAPYRHS